MTITYYLDPLSSWCHWAEPTWAALKQTYADRVEFRWRIASMRPQDFPASAEQCAWFYRRSGTLVRSEHVLHTGWWEASRAGHYPAPGLVAEAARAFLPHPEDDRARLILSQAALFEGQRIGDITTAATLVAQALNLPLAALLTATADPATAARIEQSTAAFFAQQIRQRPAFVLTNRIGDQVVFSGLVQRAPLAAALDALLDDERGYASYAAHFGPPPAV